MTKTEFSVLFETPDYIQTSDETRRFLDQIKLKMKDEFDKEHPSASEIEMHSLESYRENLNLLEMVGSYLLKINAQLDEISERQAEIFAMISADKTSK